TKVNVGDTALDSDGQTVEVVIDNKDDMTIDSGFHKPTPEVPEQPGEPEVPTPDVPEQPGEPEAPTPDMPEQPSEPKTPTPVLSEQPSHPSHKAITRPVSVGTQVDQTSHPTSKRKKQALPETGQSSTNEAPLLGGLLAVLGALFVVGRRKKQKNQ
ncbi:LPXTG cell wall anchor domain-containing protein, partial [Staphylococcus pseudintermedius]|uniref:LPXTG cell wall anchor domain-containing protein n=2 Tax=Staphylococcus pseudintermedius TaxID=283734 RepID=UPI00397F8D4A